VFKDVNDVQKLFPVWKGHVVQVEADVVAYVPGGLGA